MNISRFSIREAYHSCRPVGDAADELEEGFVLGLEPVVEPLGDALDVEGGSGPRSDVEESEFVFFG